MYIGGHIKMKRMNIEEISQIYVLAEGLNPGDEEYKVRAVAAYLKQFPIQDGLRLVCLNRTIKEMGISLDLVQKQIVLEIFDHADYTKENFIMLVEVYNELKEKGQEQDIKAYRDYFNKLHYFRKGEGRESVDIVIEELSDLESYAHENDVEFCDGVAKTLYDMSRGAYSKESIITGKLNENIRFLNDHIVKLIESEDSYQLAEIYYLLIETNDVLSLRKEVLGDASLRDKSIPNRRYDIQIESLEKIILTLDSLISRYSFALNGIEEDEDIKSDQLEEVSSDRETRIENIKSRMHNIWNNFTYKYRGPLKNNRQGFQHVYDNNPFVRKRLIPALQKLDDELVQLTGESLLKKLIQDLKDGHISCTTKRTDSTMGEDE